MTSPGHDNLKGRSAPDAEGAGGTANPAAGRTDGAVRVGGVGAAGGVAARDLPTVAEGVGGAPGVSGPRSRADLPTSDAGIVGGGGSSSTLGFSAGEDDAGSQVGPYRLIEKLGEGGFGVVYLAEQSEPVRRRVAVKIVKLGMDTREVLARFEAERQALAMMDHPHVAKVLDAGVTARGRPYFAMEYVPGLPITDYCDSARATTRERLELFLSVCQAVQHAHQKGVIHRDLKPSNIIVTLIDGRAVPKVIDFGIAKARAGGLTAATLHTEAGRILGTPEYMSPEQATSGGLDVDTRTDVYSLGAVLYELLTGTLPFDSAALRGAGHAGLVQMIREVEPPRPSSRLAQLVSRAQRRTGAARGGSGTPPGAGVTDARERAPAGGERRTRSAAAIAELRRAAPPALVRQIRGDLDWITLKAMHKDRAMRYDGASELAADIERHLRRQPVLAGPPGVIYKLRKYVSRNRTALGVTAALVLTGATVLTTLTVYRQRTAAREERIERREAIAAEVEQRALTEAQWQAYLANIAAADAAIQLGDFRGARRRLDQAPERFRNFEWWYLQGLTDASTLAVPMEGLSGPVVFLDDRTVLAGTRDGMLRVLSADDGRETRPPVQVTAPMASPAATPTTPPGTSLAVTHLAHDPARRLFAVADAAGGVTVLDGRTLSVLGRVAPPSPSPRAPGAVERVAAMAMTPDARVLGVLWSDGQFITFDTGDRSVRARARVGPQREPARQVLLDPRGERATLLLARRAVTLDLTRPDPAPGRAPGLRATDILAVDPSGRWCVAYQPQQRRLALMPVLEPASVAGSAPGEGDGPASEPGRSVVYLPVDPSARPRAWWDDRGLLVIAGDEGTLRVFDLAVLTGDLPIAPSAVTLAGQTAVRAAGAGAVLAGDAAGSTWRRALLPGHRGAVSGVGASPDGRSLASVGAADGTLRVWRADGVSRSSSLERRAPSESTAFTADGRLLACRTGLQVVVMETATWREVARFGSVDPSHAFTSSGGALVGYGPRGVSEIFTLPEGRAVDPRSPEGQRIIREGLPPGLQLSLGGPPVAIPGREAPALEVYRAGTPEPVARLERPEAAGAGLLGLRTGVTFTPSGEYMTVSPQLQTLDLYHIPSQRRVARFTSSTSTIGQFAVDPSERYLALADPAVGVVLHDLRNGQRVRVLGYPGDLSGVAFSPDSSRLAVGTGAGTATIFDVESGGEVISIRGLAGVQVQALRFSPDGSALVVTTESNVELLRVRPTAAAGARDPAPPGSGSPGSNRTASRQFSRPEGEGPGG
jgi:serine/threonine protein kinase/WD40 repeat protein